MSLEDRVAHLEKSVNDLYKTVSDLSEDLKCVQKNGFSRKGDIRVLQVSYDFLVKKIDELNELVKGMDAKFMNFMSYIEDKHDELSRGVVKRGDLIYIFAILSGIFGIIQFIISIVAK